MSALSDYLENAILNHILRNTAMAAPGANVYLALSTAATTDAGSVTEPSGNGYARKACPTASTFGAPSGGVVSNTAEVAFAAAAGGNWGTITHVAVMDASSGGNMLWHGPLTASKVINDGDVFRFPAAALQISLA